MGVLIGYPRVSTLDQNLNFQRDALTEAGCTKLFVETISGAVSDRPERRWGRGGLITIKSDCTISFETT
jgi:hypothetical protein